MAVAIAMEALCDSLVYKILSHVPVADRWLLRTVCRTFRTVVSAEATATATASDPRRRRILDDALDRAISGGGMATVRILIDRPSGVWAFAVKKAAARGDLEMVRFVDERRHRDNDDLACISAALTGGHVDVAQYLWSANKKPLDRYGFEVLMIAAAKSAKRATLEWTVSKNRKAATRALNDWPSRILLFACAGGDIESVEYICDVLTPAVCKTEFERFAELGIGVGGAHVAMLRHLRARFGYVPPPKAIARMANNHDALAYLLEGDREKVLAELLRVPAHMSPDFHAYLRSRGHRVDFDLAAAAVSVVRGGNVEQMRALMELRPDPDEWIRELGPNRLTIVFETRKAHMQALLIAFFKDRRFDFEITVTATKQTFAALRDLGGRCGCRTISRAVEHVDVEHARVVWDAMDDAARRAFFARVEQEPCYVYWAQDVDMLNFVVEELGVPKRCINYGTYVSRGGFTLEFAKAVIEHEIETPASLLARAVAYGLLDVVVHVAPTCAKRDIARCLSPLAKSVSAAPREVYAFMQRSVLERTHPLLRWLVKLLRGGAA